MEAWKGDLSQALALLDNGQLAMEVESGYARAFNRNPAEEESPTWRASLPSLLRALDGRLSEECGVVVEYMLPFNGQRIDVVLIGSDANTRDSAVSLELKDWARTDAGSEHEHFVMSGGREFLHPSAQALNYGGKLRYFHSEAQGWNVGQCAFVSGGDSRSHSVLVRSNYGILTTDAPVFFNDSLDALRARIQATISDKPKDDAVARFNRGTYSQSVELLEGLKRHQADFLSRAENVLAYNGWGLSEDQQLVEDEILGKIRRLSSDERCAFLVRGGPGSGKSLLAHRVFFGALHLNRKSIFCVRNNRLMASLREIIDPKHLGFQGVLKFNSTRGKMGVEDSDSRIADVLVCDEAQRLSLKTPNAFLRAIVTACMYDDRQILNLEEHGTKVELVEACRAAGIEPIHLELPTLHRTRGGEAYVRWVDGLLTDPGEALRGSQEWSSVYEFQTAPSPDGLRASLRRYREAGDSVGLLASFTRASGRDRPKNAWDLCKIRVPEAEPPITWLMDPQRDYVPFWVNGESSRLEKCASIYGCQGFELDRAGVLWGDDLVIRNEQWQLGRPETCYDSAPGSKPLAQVMRQQPSKALELLRNRYRILLTRGILGTYVHFEDEETRRFFADYLATPGPI